MSTYRNVTTTPSQIQLGGQPEVSLINSGTATIYLDNNASVSPENGFELPPTGQMTWNPRNELWAVTRRGTGTLQLSRGGRLQVTTRPTFDNKIFSQANSLGTPTIEVGGASSLTLVTDVYSNTSGTPVIPTYRVTWYDNDQNALAVEDYYAWAYEPQTTVVNVPVRSKYMSVLVANAGATASEYTFTVYGSSRVIGFASSARSDAPVFCTGGYADLTYSQNSAVIVGWDMTGVIALSGVSGNVSMTFAIDGSGSTYNGYLDVIDLYAYNSLGYYAPYDSLAYESLADASRYNKQMILPTATALAIATNNDPIDSVIGRTLTISWEG